MLFVQYIVLAVLVVVLSVRLSYYVDCLDKKTSLSGAFIGGVLLAAVTSLPELFTSLTAVLVLQEPQLVQGNVLGSNLFNLCIIGGILLFMANGYRDARISKSHKGTLLFSIVMFLLVLAALFFPFEVGFSVIRVNLMTVLIVIVYFINVMTMKNDTAEAEPETDIPFTVTQIVVRFVLYSLALVAASILLTQVTDQLADQLQLGATVAGAIFLGVATSLPELSSSINLVRMKNYDASFGNVIGSNLFNFTILCFADILYTGGGIYLNEAQTVVFIGFGILSSVLTLLILLGKRHPLWVRVLGLLVLASYCSGIFFSM